MAASRMWAVVAITLGLIGSTTGLVLAGRDIQSILYLYTGLAGIAATTIPLLFSVAKLNKKTDDQTVTLDQIHEQTNGILDAKIERVVRKLLDEFIGKGGTTK